MELYVANGEIPEAKTPIPEDELPEVYVISNVVINKPGPHIDADEGDGITIFGPGHKKCKAKKTIIRNVIIDFRNVPAEKQDEAICGVHGANVTMENVVIIGAKKALLCGNGQYPEVDALHGTWSLRNVAFINCGRRCPEAQDGVTVSMCNVLIENWGEAFDVRSFAIWAHSGASIMADGVLFYQKRILDEHFFIDLGNHIGEAFNERSLRLCDYIIPGRYRAASFTPDSTMVINDYYTNRLLQVQGKSGKRFGTRGGMDLLRCITEAFLKNPRFFSYIRAYCEGSILLEGLGYA